MSSALRATAAEVSGGVSKTMDVFCVELLLPILWGVALKGNHANSGRCATCPPVDPLPVLFGRFLQYQIAIAISFAATRLLRSKTLLSQKHQIRTEPPNMGTQVMVKYKCL